MTKYLRWYYKKKEKNAEILSKKMMWKTMKSMSKYLSTKLFSYFINLKEMKQSYYN